MPLISVSTFHLKNDLKYVYKNRKKQNCNTVPEKQIEFSTPMCKRNSAVYTPAQH
jgi:hypothetical protein